MENDKHTAACHVFTHLPQLSERRLPLFLPSLRASQQADKQAGFHFPLNEHQSETSVKLKLSDFLPSCVNSLENSLFCLGLSNYSFPT